MRCVLVVKWTDAAAQRSGVSLEPRQPSAHCCSTNISLRLLRGLTHAWVLPLR